MQRNSHARGLERQIQAKSTHARGLAFKNFPHSVAVISCSDSLQNVHYFVFPKIILDIYTPYPTFELPRASYLHTSPNPPPSVGLFC